MSKPTLTVLSLGAGVQSTTLALMACEGLTDRPDAAVFADTGWEPQRVYRHLDLLADALNTAGIPLHRVSAGNIRADALDPEHRYCSIPYFVRNPDGGRGIGRRQCTGEYKLKPIKACVRELLGYPHPRPVPKDVYAEQWIGFSVDEIHRVRDALDVKYARPRYPLIELGMSRKDCTRWLKSRGWAQVEKSACIGCPFHGNRQWRDLRDNYPDEWADAVQFDAAIRKGGARGLPLDGEAFLHSSRVPLAVAPIDHVTRPEWADRQMDLLDAIADIEAGVYEDGDPDGCSPYGCRSGAPVV